LYQSNNSGRFDTLPLFQREESHTPSLAEEDFLYVISHLIELFVNDFFGCKDLHFLTDYGGVGIWTKNKEFFQDQTKDPGP
jgi:hypothetical protein